MAKYVLIAFPVDENGESSDGPLMDDVLEVAKISAAIGVPANVPGLHGFWSIETGLSEAEAEAALQEQDREYEANRTWEEVRDDEEVNV